MLNPNIKILGRSRVVSRGMARVLTPRTICAVDAPGRIAPGVQLVDKSFYPPFVFRAKIAKTNIFYREHNFFSKL